MTKEDRDKMTFIVVGDTYYYVVMPFGLKNIRATYWRFVNNIFIYIKGKCVEVYVDDILVKSQCLAQHIEDLKQVFEVLQNP